MKDDNSVVAKFATTASDGKTYNVEYYSYAINQRRLEYLEKTVKLIDIANRIDERLEGKLNISEEIESFKWYESADGEEILSNTLKNEVIPYCLRNNLIN